MKDESVYLGEGARVEKDIYPFTRRQFTLGMLLLYPLGITTLACFSFHPFQVL